jgi:polysaccharide biosynthesis/export protein
MNDRSLVRRVRCRLEMCAAVIVALSFAAQSFAQPGAAAALPATVAAESASGYRVGPEDVLEISVWKEDNLKKEVLVRPDGGISFPLAGDLHAAGKTAQEIRDEITQRLGKFISDPVVSVSVLKIASKIYVIGRVNKPGEFLPGRYVDVLQGLSMAGGLTPFAAENDIKVLRKENGRELTFPFRYSEVKRGINLEQNITLKGGDVVVVP